MSEKDGALSASQGANLSSCWCGETDCESTCHPVYVSCKACGTARIRDANAWSGDLVNGEEGLYSQEYWGAHQVDDFGYPPIEERAVSDLSGRCMQWLSVLLRHVLPPAHFVEIGCAHGGFVKLCKMAGFDALGVEMAADIVGLAQRTFGVDVRKGPFDELECQFGGETVVYCMFDVIEHVPFPLETLRDLLNRSSGRVVLILQTPEFRKPVHASVFKVPEHLHLFTRDSLSSALRRVGFSAIQFEESCFSYDMTVVASNVPLVENPEAAVVEALLRTGDGRVLNAMRGLAGRLGEAREKNRLLDGDGMGIRWASRQLVRSVLRRLGLRGAT